MFLCCDNGIDFLYFVFAGFSWFWCTTICVIMWPAFDPDYCLTGLNIMYFANVVVLTAVTAPFGIVISLLLAAIPFGIVYGIIFSIYSCCQRNREN
jgi:hypothetical protein